MPYNNYSNNSKQLRKHYPHNTTNAVEFEIIRMIKLDAKRPTS